MKYIIFKKYGIQASSARRAMVSDEDFERVNAHKWRETPTGYIERSFRISPTKTRKERLHRFILGVPPVGLFIDHVNGLKYDNQRENLRFCTTAENMRNRRGREGKRGTVWIPSRGVWRADIRAPGMKRKFIGHFGTQEEAHEAYKVASLKYFGDFSPYATKVE